MVDQALEVVYRLDRPIESFPRDRAKGLAAAIDRETYSAPSWIGADKDRPAVHVKYGHFSSLDSSIIEGSKAVVEEEFDANVESWRVSITSPAQDVDFASQ